MIAREIGCRGEAGGTPGELPKIASAAEFFAYALAIEDQAVTRYGELAERMQAQQSYVLAPLFRMLATQEAEHAETIRRRMRALGAQAVAVAAFHGRGPDSPEAMPRDLMGTTRLDALVLALAGERRAKAFFAEVAAAAADAAVRKLAAEFAQEEAHHIRILERLIISHGGAAY